MKDRPKKTNGYGPGTRRCIGQGASTVTYGEFDGDGNLVITSYPYGDDDVASLGHEPVEQIVIPPEQQAEISAQLVNPVDAGATVVEPEVLLTVLQLKFTGLEAVKVWLERKRIGFFPVRASYKRILIGGSSRGSDESLMI